MEKMNQVSVSEFFAKSKEEMYDMAVEMVEKYNRLVDICNDSAERMAELMAKDDINEFKKELQSKAPGEFKIQKLSDIVVWADGIIRDAGYNEEKYKSDGATAYCHVKAYELWRIRDVVLESMERRTVYSNALNNDIADKAAKIELLEKEIEGRKEGYYALKELMDTKYISIDEHNDICKAYENKVAELKKESEKWQDLAKMNRDTICNQYDVCEDFKKKIAEIEEENEKLKVDLIHEREKNEKLARAHAELENDIRKYTTEIKTLEEKVKRQKENLDGINKTLEIRTKENERLIAVRNNKDKEIEAHESENARLTEKIIELKEEVKKRDKCIMEKNESINTGNEAIVNLRKQIGAHEEENKKLKESINRLTMHCRAKNTEIARLTKENADIRHEYAKMTAELEFKKKEDDHGKSGFKRYIEHLIEEEERAVPERFKARLNEEITEIFTKEEETKIKGNGRTSSGRYPWGAKVNDIPCGEDAIE